MNLLIITNNPNRASFRQRVGVYLDTLKAGGINFEIMQLPTSFFKRRRLFMRAANFDGVFLHKKKLNVTDAFYLRRYAEKIIYNYDDAVMYSEKDPEHYSSSHFVPFKRTVKLADMIITGSSYLAEHARKFNSNVEIIPIGLKVSDYAPACPDRTDDKIRLVWIGSKSTLNYLEEIKPALEEIGRRYDNALLRIVCDEFLELRNMPVEKRLWSEDMRGINLATSDIGLASLPDNRFTKGKCSFKVLEYAAAGLPAVASPVGTNTEHIRENVTGFFAKDMQQWVDRISCLIENPDLRGKMGENARIFAGTFDIGVIGQQLVKLIKECIGQ